MKIRNFALLFFMTLGLSFMACSGTKSGVTDSTKSTEKAGSVKVTDSSLPLSAYLRRVPGVRVTGSGSNAKVTIAGSSVSGTGEKLPLFVVDNTPVGNTLNAVESMVSVNDIDKVKVLKGSQASAEYGMRGSAGVILIKTKKN
ncbi:MAG: Plug domain-containing protein [Bacteroidetes bacterium]|nr:Plug domain-containing protein [Bacteroidota bacterium]